MSCTSLCFLGVHYSSSESSIRNPFHCVCDAAQLIKDCTRGCSTSALFERLPRMYKTKTSESLFGQKWAEWHHFSVSSGRIHGRYDGDPGQRQLTLRLHHLGCGPERLPVRGRNIWQSQGISDVSTRSIILNALFHLTLSCLQKAEVVRTSTFTGCMGETFLDGKPIGLWNYRQRQGDCKGCVVRYTKRSR